MSKRAVSSVLALALLSSVTLQSRRCDAAVGGLLSLFGAGAGVPVMIVGGAVAAGGVAIFGGALIDAAVNPNVQNDPDGMLGDALIAASGVVVLALGLIVLDDHQTRRLAYANVSDAQARAIGLTGDELSAYRGELDEINAVSDSIGDTLARTARPSTEQAQGLWVSYKQELSPEAFSAVAKISAKALEAARAARR